MTARPRIDRRNPRPRLCSTTRTSSISHSEGPRTGAFRVTLISREDLCPPARFGQDATCDVASTRRPLPPGNCRWRNAWSSDRSGSGKDDRVAAARGLFPASSGRSPTTLRSLSNGRSALKSANTLALYRRSAERQQAPLFGTCRPVLHTSGLPRLI